MAKIKPFFWIFDIIWCVLANRESSFCGKERSFSNVLIRSQSSIIPVLLWIQTLMLQVTYKLYSYTKDWTQALTKFIITTTTWWCTDAVSFIFLRFFTTLCVSITLVWIITLLLFLAIIVWLSFMFTWYSSLRAPKTGNRRIFVSALMGLAWDKSKTAKRASGMWSKPKINAVHVKSMSTCRDLLKLVICLIVTKAHWTSVLGNSQICWF